ncbi:glycosyltransferase family 2 protein [Thermococcus paralvinellae]|uniref:Glycosyl transferase family protein 16 n=1 Tax=Thermococcus paralvinellae TaxID=582419 RepID=W0I5M0_9EURY|nr:glycosyltransferase family 2 protein [Thermococcus paralvinellae]AHF81411.1 glycosyl transferase family protein 16 [Thermococcus paralvinellae]
MYKNTKVLIVIPAYNEELTIGSVVALAKEYGDVLVVDDGSKDKTSKIAQEVGAIVLRHDVNKGKGQALKTGFDYALANDYDVVVCIDADGQHNPEEIPLLLKPILEDEADLVIGSRYLNGAHKTIPIYRRLGLWILNKTTVLASGVKITDSQSGFRALNRRALESLNLNSSGYNVESEMIHQLSEKNLRITEVPINVRYDVPNKHKKHPIAHGVGVLAKIVGLIGYKRPLLLFGVLSLISFIIAGILGYLALEPYYNGGNVYLTQAIGAGIFAIIGIQLFVAGLTLNVLSRMVGGK